MIHSIVVPLQNLVHELKLVFISDLVLSPCYLPASRCGYAITYPQSHFLWNCSSLFTSFVSNAMQKRKLTSWQTNWIRYHKRIKRASKKCNPVKWSVLQTGWQHQWKLLNRSISQFKNMINIIAANNPLICSFHWKIILHESIWPELFLSNQK